MDPNRQTPTDSFDVGEIEEVKWGLRICNCGCQEIADPTTSVLFHDEHGDNQVWLYEEFNTRTDYSIKLVPIRIPSNLKHVEMYREAAREMRSPSGVPQRLFERWRDRDRCGDPCPALLLSS